MPRKIFTTLELAMKAAADQDIYTVAAWRAFARSEAGRNLRVPVNPPIVYKNEWVGWPAFFQVDWRVSKPPRATLRPFESAREFARSLGFTRVEQWQAYAQSLDCPEDLPADPRRAYEGLGFAGYPDFLGYNPETGSEKSFWEFESARRYARGLRLPGALGYRKWAKTGGRPQAMPTHPERTYANSWKSWRDFLKGDRP